MEGEVQAIQRSVDSQNEHYDRDGQRFNIHEIAAPQIHCARRQAEEAEGRGSDGGGRENRSNVAARSAKVDA